MFARVNSFQRNVATNFHGATWIAYNSVSDPGEYQARLLGTDTFILRRGDSLDPLRSGGIRHLQVGYVRGKQGQGVYITSAFN